MNDDVDVNDDDFHEDGYYSDGGGDKDVNEVVQCCLSVIWVARHHDHHRNPNTEIIYWATKGRVQKTPARKLSVEGGTPPFR